MVLFEVVAIDLRSRAWDDAQVLTVESLSVHMLSFVHLQLLKSTCGPVFKLFA